MIAWLDNTILDWFQSIHNDMLTNIFRIITTLGEAGVVWILIGLILIIQRNTRWVGMTMLLALLFSLLVGNVTLKPLVARPRPCWRHPEIELLIANPTDYSFPSGHAMSSFAAATAVFMWHWRWGIAALLGAVVMACTRLYFYVHYPTDILAGMLIGILLGILAYAGLCQWKKSWEKRRGSC